MKTVQEAIIDAWNNYLISSRISSEESTKAKKFYISDMGKCLRMRYLKRKGIKGIYGADTYFTFALGDFIHQLGYKALEAANMLVATEQYVENDHFIGKYDGKVRWDGKVYMFDFKSTNPYVLKRIIAGGPDNLENIMQVLTYFEFEKGNDKDLEPISVVTYINKLASDKIEPTIIHPRAYFYDTYKKLIKDDMSKLLDHWLADTIPACSCPSWSSQKYNSFFMFCHMTDKDIRKHLNYLKAGKKIESNGFEIFIKDPQIGGGEEQHG